MRYQKKLIVMCGRGRGVLTLEKSGLGVSARFVSDVKIKGATLGIILRGACFVRDYDGFPVSLAFDEDISYVHAAIIKDGGVILYGTTERERMWEANILQLIERNDTFKPREDNYYSGLELYNDRVESFLDGDRVTAINDKVAPTLIYSQRGDDDLLSAATAMGGLAFEEKRASEKTDEPENVSIDEPAPQSAPKEDSESKENPNDEASLKDGESSEAEQSKKDETPEGEESLENGESPKAEIRYNEESQSNEEDLRSEISSQGEEGEREKTELNQNENFNRGEELDMGVLRYDEDGAFDEVACCNYEVPPYKREAEYLSEYFENVEIVPPTITLYPIEKVKHAPVLREATALETHKPDVERLFTDCPHDEELERALPHTSWVKVELEDGNTVSVGIMNERLCYAVIGSYSDTPPSSLIDPKFVPLERTSPRGKGYWIMADE